jgi:hypothetical protein
MDGEIMALNLASPLHRFRRRVQAADEDAAQHWMTGLPAKPLIKDSCREE